MSAGNIENIENIENRVAENHTGSNRAADLREQARLTSSWDGLRDVLTEAQAAFDAGELTGEEVESLAGYTMDRSRLIPEDEPPPTIPTLEESPMNAIEHPSPDRAPGNCTLARDCPECSGATREELVKLVRYWTNQFLGIRVEWLWGYSGGSEDAWRKIQGHQCIAKITSTIGIELVLETIEQEENTLRDSLGPEDGRIFFDGSTEERKAMGNRWEAFEAKMDAQKEAERIHRDLSSPKSR